MNARKIRGARVRPPHKTGATMAGLVRRLGMTGPSQTMVRLLGRTPNLRKRDITPGIPDSTDRTWAQTSLSSNHAETPSSEESTIVTGQTNLTDRRDSVGGTNQRHLPEQSCLWTTGPFANRYRNDQERPTRTDADGPVLLNRRVHRCLHRHRVDGTRPVSRRLRPRGHSLRTISSLSRHLRRVNRRLSNSTKHLNLDMPHPTRCPTPRRRKRLPTDSNRRTHLRPAALRQRHRWHRSTRRRLTQCLPSRGRGSRRTWRR